MGSKVEKSMRVPASDDENIDSEDKDYHFRASKLWKSVHPVKPMFQNDPHLNSKVQKK